MALRLPHPPTHPSIKPHSPVFSAGPPPPPSTVPQHHSAHLPDAASCTHRCPQCRHVDGGCLALTGQRPLGLQRRASRAPLVVGGDGSKHAVRRRCNSCADDEACTAELSTLRNGSRRLRGWGARRHCTHGVGGGVGVGGAARTVQSAELMQRRACQCVRAGAHRGGGLPGACTRGEGDRTTTTTLLAHLLPKPTAQVHSAPSI